MRDVHKKKQNEITFYALFLLIKSIKKEIFFKNITQIF